MDMQELLKILACPACHHPLKTAEKGLICEHCRAIYPIRDGIPILLIEAALPLGPNEERNRKCES